jgi:hypothetical protein
MEQNAKYSNEMSGVRTHLTPPRYCVREFIQTIRGAWPVEDHQPISSRW